MHGSSHVQQQKSKHGKHAGKGRPQAHHKGSCSAKWGVSLLAGILVCGRSVRDNTCYNTCYFASAAPGCMLVTRMLVPTSSCRVAVVYASYTQNNSR
jgi:hypothetical protein